MKEGKKTAKEMIAVTGKYFDLVDGHLWMSIMKEKFPNRKVQYRIMRALDFIAQQSKPYKREKERLVNEFAEKDGDGKVRETKVQGGGSIVNISDMKAFNAELEKIQADEVKIPLERIEVDLEKDLPAMTGEQMMFIDPFIIVNE